MNKQQNEALAKLKKEWIDKLSKLNQMHSEEKEKTVSMELCNRLANVMIEEFQVDLEALASLAKPTESDGLSGISERSFPLTKKMQDAKAVVVAFTKEHGRPPSYQELAEKLRVSKSTAHFRMKHMRNLMTSH